MKHEQVESFEERLKFAMALRGKKQIDIAKHFGWSRSTMSQYCDPRIGYRPKADRMYQIAEYLNVSPVWLMGYDVPIDGMDKKQKLLEKINGMNADEIERMSAYIEAFQTVMHLDASDVAKRIKDTDGEQKII